MQSLGSFKSLVLGMSASVQLLAPLGGWESHGPPFPFASDVAVSPDNDMVVYSTATDAVRGSNGQHPSAVFRSSDGGLTWLSLASAPAGERVTAVAIDPLNPSRLLASTVSSLGSRVYRTPDAGATWYATLDFPQCFGPAIAFDRTLAGRAYAACDELLRTDDGTTWSTLGVSAPPYSRLLAGADGAVYQVESDQVLRSDDHGDSWSGIVSAPASCPSITALAVDPENSSVMYVGTGQATPQGHFACGGLYESVDGGSTLSRTPLPDQYVTDIAVDSRDPSTIYTSSVNVGFFSPTGRVSQSLDAGQTWRDFGAPGLQIGKLALSNSGGLLYGSANQATGGVFRRSIRKTQIVSPRATN